MKEIALATLGYLDVTAGSGIALAGDVAYVIADDVACLSGYALDTRRTITLPLFPGDAAMPADYKARKQIKADLEALVALPDARLLALGSGSRSNRRRGAFVEIATRTVRDIDASGIYEALDREFAKLNVEGAVVWRDRLLLAQRGNGRDDAIVALDLDVALRDLAKGVLSKHALRSVTRVDLGKLDGVALGFTDLAAHPSRGVFFVAAAEATDDPVNDAACSGSILGRLDEDLRIASSARLRPDLKVEGLGFWKTQGESDRWLMVSDADDPMRPSPLLTAQTAPAF